MFNKLERMHIMPLIMFYLYLQMKQPKGRAIKAALINMFILTMEQVATCNVKRDAHTRREL